MGAMALQFHGLNKNNSNERGVHNPSETGEGTVKSTGVLVTGGLGALSPSPPPPNKIKTWLIFNSIHVILKYLSKFSS